MKKVPIIINTPNALKWLGSLYRNPADALKEHISNAIDEYFKDKNSGETPATCVVNFKIEKDKIIIEYPYGMSEDEFETALKSVADSAKKSLDIKQIGSLGIGIFSFIQIGKNCTFFSRKDHEHETIKVTLREGNANAEFETPKKSELLDKPGIKIIISNLLFDATKPRSPLCLEKLTKLFSEKFRSYLEEDIIKINIYFQGKVYDVKPLRIDLPRVGKEYKNWNLTKNPFKKFSLDLYFDPTNKGKVAIRHMGVVVVEDIRELNAYGLEESIYAQGSLHGYIDADFLKTLPARTGFEENEDWISLLDELDRLRPSIEAEVEILRQEEEDKTLTKIQKKAIELAHEILNMDDFKDLELPEGLGRKRPEPRFPENGFAFVPSSIRIEVGETGTLALKAEIPKVLQNDSTVYLKVDLPFVKLKEERVILKVSEADASGIVTKHVHFEGIKETSEPVSLVATVDSLTAVAHIRVAEKVQKREPVGKGEEGEGPRITYEEIPFEDGPSKHSRYLSKKIQINERNKDYLAIKREKSEQLELLYATLLIGKEIIAFGDKSGAVDDYLEKLLFYYFELQRKIAKIRYSKKDSYNKSISNKSGEAKLL
jgi:hypothetical protein